MNKALTIALICTLTPLLALSEAPKLNPLYIFCHGLGANNTQADQYKKTGLCREKETYSFNFGDVCPRGYNPEEVNLGQEQDVAMLSAHCKKYTLKQLVLFGVSRGAATCINFLGTQPCQSVVAAILESPFDHGKSIALSMVPTIVARMLPSSSDTAHESLMPYLFKKYNPHGLQPIETIAAIPAHIPLLLLCSEQDAIVPAQSTKNIYLALQNAGRKNVHLVVLSHGKHANLLWGPDGHKYLAAVHAFYKKYGLPYVENLAAEGEIYLFQEST